MPSYWLFIILLLMFLIGFGVGFYNWQILNARKDTTRHSVGLGIGIVFMFLSLLGAAAGPIITKVDVPTLPIEPVIQSLHWTDPDVT